TVGGEALLRGEVVGISLGDVHRKTTSAGGGVDQDERVTCRTGDVHHRARGGLVVSPRDDVRVRVIQLGRGRCGAWFCLDDLRGVEPRRLLGHGGELAGELAIGEEGGLVADQAEASGVPERGRATEGEDDLVTLRAAEQLAQAYADAADDIPDSSLAVGGANDGRAICDGLQLSWENLGRAATEATAVGDELLGQGWQFVGWVCHRFGPSLRC